MRVCIQGTCLFQHNAFFPLPQPPDGRPLFFSFLANRFFTQALRHFIITQALLLCLVHRLTRTTPGIYLALLNNLFSGCLSSRI
jgi:hypothetical protein